MSFIDGGQGKIYAPGYFLAHEECVRKTYEIPQAGATTAENGGKYVPIQTVTAHDHFVQVVCLPRNRIFLGRCICAYNNSACYDEDS